jgi:hypothetical protein
MPTVNPGMADGRILGSGLSMLASNTIYGGVTYTRVSETLPIPGTGVSSSLHGSGALGMFGGLAIEKNFLESPFSIFAEAQHNFVRHDLIDQVGDYGGANLTLGIRYYFKERRTS